MSPSILDFPPELVHHILTFLPLRSLLKFSETCHGAHGIAKSSLHTLSLEIHSSRWVAQISRLSATEYPRLKSAISAFPRPDDPYDISCSIGDFIDYMNKNYPYRASVIIPGGSNIGPMTLLAFHTALTKRILTNHGATLQHLELSLWTLTLPVAKTLASLPALRTLSVRFNELPYLRGIPRKIFACQKDEQRQAWSLLTESAVWAPRLKALRIECADITIEQLSTLLRKSRQCRELWLCDCDAIDSKLWGILEREWKGSILGVMHCGHLLNEESLDSIGNLKNLQVSNWFRPARFIDGGSN
jgi:hypothetical protein